MRLTLVGALTALTIMPVNAGEELDSANFLLPYCKTAVAKASPSTFLEGLCVGKIVTAAQIAELIFRPGRRIAKDEFKCLEVPDGVANSELIRVVIKYVEATPERMHKPLHVLALDAFFDAWPCKK